MAGAEADRVAVVGGAPFEVFEVGWSDSGAGEGRGRTSADPAAYAKELADDERSRSGSTPQGSA